MTDTSFYSVKAKLSFDIDPLEQILKKAESSVWFNSLESEFEISGYVNAAIDSSVYFNIEKMLFVDLDDMRNGIAVVELEAGFAPSNIAMAIVSAFINDNNKFFRLVDCENGHIEIDFNQFKLEECYDS